MIDTVPITIWLTKEQADAVRFEAQRYQQTPDERVLAWVAASLNGAMKMHDAAKWEQRKRTLEVNARLAATVDAEAAR